MPRAWRITKAKYARRAFDGEGARRFGSRWSSPGLRVVFAAESLSLAALEILVHLEEPMVLRHYVVFTVDFPAKLVRAVNHRKLPKNWRDFPAPQALQGLGDAWLRRGQSAILRVPSVIIPHERNYLFNPAHPDFAKVRISRPMPLDVDRRVFGR